MLGDVVIADMVMGYESGRQTESGLEPRFAYKQPPRRVLTELRHLNLTLTRAWHDRFRSAQKFLERRELPSRPIRRGPKSHFGVVASGEKLFADGALGEYRKRYHERIRAGDMEAIGFVTAAERADVPWIVVRGISDFGDPATKEGRQKDRFHATAANASATYVRTLLENTSEVLFSQSKMHSGGRTRPDTGTKLEELANQILTIFRAGSSESRRTRSQLYQLANTIEELNLASANDLLLAERYAVQMDYNPKCYGANTLHLSLLALSRSPATEFDEILTGTTAISNDELELEVVNASRPGVYATVDKEKSTAQSKYVSIHFPPLTRGKRLQVSLRFTWGGHSRSQQPLRWHEFSADFLAAQLELVVLNEKRIRFFGVVEQTGSGEPKVLEKHMFIAKRQSSRHTVVISTPRFDRKYTVRFELLPK